MEEWRLRGKDADPMTTVEHIKELLDRAGIKTVYREGDVSINGCCYSRLSMDSPYGEIFASNGKGMTKELCMASAYGEYMERIQNMMFAAGIRIDDPEISCFFSEDSPLYDPKAEEQPECIDAIIEKVAASIKNPSVFMNPRAMAVSLFEDLAPECAHGKYPTELYYSVKDGCAVYLPTVLLQLFTFSNGMAAGNTIEEAFVEGISEIFERYSQIKFYQGGITPPCIPDEEIDKWPRIRTLINEVEKSGRFKVDIRDCSLGKKLPVVCTIFTDTHTGNTGIKFGAQPDMGVAMERTFTEAVQGKTVVQASNCNSPTFIIDRPGERGEKWNTIKVGFGQVPAHIMAKKPSYPFKPWPAVEGKDNAQLSRELIALAEGIGGDVYIRDNSFLGFPAVNIYISGVSEAKPVDALTLKEHLLGNSVKKMFADLSSLDDEQVQKLLLLANMKSGAVLENTIAAISGNRSLCPIKGLGFEANLLQITACYRLGNYDAALALIGTHVSLEESLGGDPYTSKYFFAVKLFIEGKKTDSDPEIVRAVIEKCCGSEIADRVEYEFEDKNLTLSRMFESKEIKEEANRQYAFIVETYKKLGALKNSVKTTKEAVEKTFKGLGF